MGRARAAIDRIGIRRLLSPRDATLNSERLTSRLTDRAEHRPVVHIELSVECRDKRWNMRLVDRGHDIDVDGRARFAGER